MHRMHATVKNREILLVPATSCCLSGRSINPLVLGHEDVCCDLGFMSVYCVCPGLWYMIPILPSRPGTVRCEMIIYLQPTSKKVPERVVLRQVLQVLYTVTIQDSRPRTRCWASRCSRSCGGACAGCAPATSRWARRWGRRTWRARAPRSRARRTATGRACATWGGGVERCHIVIKPEHNKQTPYNLDVCLEILDTR